MSLKDAEKLAVKILKEVMEEKLTCVNAQVAAVNAEGVFHIYTEEELGAIMASL